MWLEVFIGEVVVVQAAIVAVITAIDRLRKASEIVVIAIGI